jgi:hypothetical protein
MAIPIEILKGDGYEDYLEEHAPNFKLFFDQLRLLLCENEESLNDEITSPTVEQSLQNSTGTSVSFLDTSSRTDSSPASMSKKPPNSLIIMSPAKMRIGRPEEDPPKTPDQPTVPKDPAFTGDSIESADEDETKLLIKILFKCTFFSLRASQISWPKYAEKCRFTASAYSLKCHFSDTSRQERLSFALGRKNIIAINDGAIIIEYSRPSKRLAKWGIYNPPRKIRSVVSFEVYFHRHSTQLTVGQTKTRERNSSRMASRRTNILRNVRPSLSSRILFHLLSK